MRFVGNRQTLRRVILSFGQFLVKSLLVVCNTYNNGYIPIIPYHINYTILNFPKEFIIKPLRLYYSVNGIVLTDSFIRLTASGIVLTDSFIRLTASGIAFGSGIVLTDSFIRLTASGIAFGK